MNTTILYYTSNREGDNFEGRIKDNIVKVSGGLPIISVSQKPIEFGKNICVGEVGASGFNMFRQVQIGLREANTRFVVSAEADCLYPKDYFQFEPTRDDVCYRTTNTYVLPQERSFFFRKFEGATHAQVINREFYLNRLDELFKDAPEWSMEERNFPKERHGLADIFDEIMIYKSKYPVVQIKTHRSMRHYTETDRTPIHKIPYWGDGKKFRSKYYGDN